MDMTTGEIGFTLPRGYLDSAGQVQRLGIMRPALAIDEIEALQDPRVQANEAYLSIVLLSRVIVQLGSLAPVTPQMLERMYAADVAYLEDVYLRLNAAEPVLLDVICPQCSGRFQVQAAPLMEESEA